MAYCFKTGKHRHRTRHEAGAHLATLPHKRGEPMNIFYCRYCESFHVGRERTLGRPLKRRAAL